MAAVSGLSFGLNLWWSSGQFCSVGSVTPAWSERDTQSERRKAQANFAPFFGAFGSIDLFGGGSVLWIVEHVSGGGDVRRLFFTRATCEKIFSGAQATLVTTVAASETMAKHCRFVFHLCLFGKC